jgi:ribonuclease G
MNKELYVSTTPHETKVALVEDDQLAEVYFERENEYTLAGSIYKGRVTRVLPGMQSAFVDIGLERDAFLYVSDFLELQDEDEDGEFSDVKVTGSTLAQANGLILAEPQPAEEDSEELPEEASVEAEGDKAEAGKDAGTPFSRGRRRRRGRRGGRDRVAGDRPAEAQPGTTSSEEWPSEAASSGESADAPAGRDPEVAAPREQKKRELRGFEPRGLVVHGLARSKDAEEVEPESGAQPAEDEPTFDAPVSNAPTREAKPASTAANSYTPMMLPGESISKYSRADGEAPAPAPPVETGASEESDRGYSRGRERDRGDRGDRGGRGRRGDRDRDRGRERETREPREAESSALPENYTPILLPGESISKYRGTEPLAVPDPVERTAPRSAEENPDEPLSSASYSGASRLPSLTQRFTPEVEEPEAEVEAVVEPAQEAAPEETAAAAPVEPTREEPVIQIPSAEAAHFEPATEPVFEPVVEQVTPQAEEHHEEAPAERVEADAPEEAATREGRNPDRRSWRGRVAKNFGSGHEEGVSQPEPEVESAAGESQAGAEGAPGINKATEAEPVHFGGQLGSFVIEGGHVEHEELDEEETEMPALAEHFDRYEESESEGDALDDGSGSQFGTAVRETGEEDDLENEEYDFGGEEFEESELLAEGADDEEEEGGEESEEPEVAAAAPGAVSPRPERFDRRDRRGRRGTPPPRGGGRMRARTPSRALPLISELLKEGQEILVQIAKEPIGKKGARITSHIALPGRFLVYMPTVNHIGVSRKISSEEERQRLKRIVSSERENGHGGFIVRTAASNIKEDELRADIRFLKHLWTEIRTRAESGKSPALIYHDLNLVERILRDQVTSDFSQIWVDNESEYERVVRFASRFQPSLVRRIKLYSKDTPLYEQFGINEEINKSLKSKVWLKSGGYIVINQTEALVAIDINTGKYVGKTARLEDTIVKTNCDAVKEIVRQIRLRDLGGIIVVDFIDMDERKNRQKVMQALEEAMKADRAPSKILQFNDFGLVAITRKRVKQSLERTLGTPCPYCDATGFVKSVQTVCNEIFVEMRKVRRHVESKEVILRVNPEVAKELKGGNGKWLQEMEELLGHPVLVKSDAQLHQEKFDMNY